MSPVKIVTGLTFTIASKFSASFIGTLRACTADKCIHAEIRSITECGFYNPARVQIQFPSGWNLKMASEPNPNPKPFQNLKFFYFPWVQLRLRIKIRFDRDSLIKTSISGLYFDSLVLEWQVGGGEITRKWYFWISKAVIIQISQLNFFKTQI